MTRGQAQSNKGDRPRSSGGGSGGGGGSKRRGRRGSRRSSRGKGSRKGPRGPKPPDPAEIYEELPPRQYGVMFYDSTAQAKEDMDTIREKAAQVDQLNVVIRAEAVQDMDDPDLNAVEGVKVFAGTAWTIIHERRLEEGWYDEPR